MNKIILMMAVMISFVTFNNANAQLRIDVTKGYVEPMPIAVTNFSGGNASEEALGRKMATVISANLNNSGLFRTLNPESFIQKKINFLSSPVFSDWRAINSQALVIGDVKKQRDGKTKVEFRLWDVFSEKQIIGMSYNTKPDNWRRIAHIISDEIYKRMTGEMGYFDTRIVYISEKGPANKRIKRLAIMDQDGQNHRYLTAGKELVLTPRFSPNQQKITYMSYYKNKPRVYLYDIDTGRQQILGDFKGMTFSPRFSPDGKSVIMSMSKNGNSDIYTMNISTRKVNRLTSNSSIETSPSYAPDGKKIVFESDRGGSQQLYVMNANGSNSRRITFGQGRYANPVWSPRGDLIAFTRMYKGKFYIGVIRPDGSGERLITNAYHVEGPTWAPNGRVIGYFKEKPKGNSRQANLYTIDLTGHNEKRIRTPVDGSDPAWSPLN